MIDPEAKVDPSVLVPDNTFVWGLSRIHAGVKLGEHVAVGEMVYIGRGAKIGDRTRIMPQAHITDRMTIGRSVFIGPGVVFMNDKHPIANNPLYKVEPPIVEDFVSVGSNATILPGVRLGEGCVIGAGAVVTKDVPAWQTWAGNPAKRLGPAPPAPSVTGEDRIPGDSIKRVPPTQTGAGEQNECR